MDKIDHEILEILRENARITNNAIAARVRLSEGAIRNRIRRLMDEGVIKKFTIETQVNLAEAIVLVKTQTRGSKEILRRIRRYANRLFETAGEYDAAAYLSAENITEINQIIDKVRRVDGVTSTVTLLKIADDESFT
jgi:Lrp/AsnC family transcriptional regulator of lysine biosynthesis